MSKIIAVANQKGGVGKTTTAINLSASLALMTQETLLIDLDPQANATSGLGINKNDITKSVYHAITEQLPLNEIIVSTSIDFLDLLPANNDLVGVDVELASMISRENKLKTALEQVKNMYEYIIIDCPPSLGLLTINALTACNSILIPIQCEYYALEGVSQLLATIELVRKNINPNLEIEGVLLTMYDSRANLNVQVFEEIRKHFNDKVYKTIIPRNIRLAEAPGFGKPVFFYDKASKGSEAYMSLAEEFLKIKPKKTEEEPVLS